MSQWIFEPESGSGSKTDHWGNPLNGYNLSPSLVRKSLADLRSKCWSLWLRADLNASSIYGERP